MYNRQIVGICGIYFFAIMAFQSIAEYNPQGNPHFFFLDMHHPFLKSTPL